eukprot:6397230-Heterocapsa_arctica.AAC.1
MASPTSARLATSPTTWCRMEVAAASLPYEENLKARAMGADLRGLQRPLRSPTTSVAYQRQG